MPSQSSDRISANYKPVICAHRGASGYLPEHTLVAKAMAYAMQPDYIEQDVVMTKDDVPVILHDHTLETTTDVERKFPNRHRADGSYYAIDFTLAEIKSLTVTERFNPTTGAAIFPQRFPVGWGIDFRISTLDEEFKLIQGLNRSTGKDVGVYVEIKEPAFHEGEGKRIVQAVIDCLTEYGYNRPDTKAILQIFDYEAIKAARALGWTGDLAMLVDGDGQALKKDGERHRWLMTRDGIADISRYATIYAPWFSHLAVPNADGNGYTLNDLANIAREHGMKVHSWTHRIDAPPKGFKDSDEMLDIAFKVLKLDGLFSDFPDNAVAYLNNNGLR